MRQVSRVRSYRFSLRGRRPVSVSFHAYAKKPRDGMHNGIVMRVASKRGLPHNKPTRPRPCQRSIRLFSSTNESWIPPKETLPDKIPHGPGGYWTQRENRVTFFNWLFHRLNLKSMDDWYSVTRNEVYRYGGSSLLVKRYKNALWIALKDVYPTHKWEEWRFKSAPRWHWASVENQRAYFDSIGPTIGVNTLSDWYRITPTDHVALEGEMNRIRSITVNYYAGSMAMCLMTVYPTHNWDVWRFHRVPRDYWDPATLSAQDALKYTEALAGEMSVDELEDWYRVSVAQLSAAPMSIPPAKYGGLIAVLQKAYPDHSWNIAKFDLQSKKASQRKMKSQIEKLLSHLGKLEILEDYRHPEMLYSSTGLKMELDLYIPALQLGIEYQGPQHYHDLYNYAQRRARRMRDWEKAKMCESRGITLVEIPYWWDEQSDSLAAELKHARSNLEIEVDMSQLISRHPPTRFLLKHAYPKRRDIIAQQFNIPSQRAIDSLDFDPTNWIIMNNVSGILVRWDHGQLLTFSGYPLRPPTKWTEMLPASCVIQGILVFESSRTMSRDEFHLALSNTAPVNWESVELQAFDTKLNGNYTERLQYLTSLSSAPHSPLRVIPWTVCTGTRHLREVLEDKDKHETEKRRGVVLTSPFSGDQAKIPRYQIVSSNHQVLKLLVTALPPHCLSETDLLECTTHDSKIAIIPFGKHADAARDVLHEGSLLEVEHSGASEYIDKSSGQMCLKLDNARIIAERMDVNWDDVLYQHSSIRRSAG